jgi:hypothetical protein
MSHATIPSDWTPLQEAQYRTVHEFRRGNQKGAVALSPMLEKSSAVISNEVNPAVTTHKQSIEDSITLQLLTDDYGILYAYCQALNHLAIHLPESDSVSDVELLNQLVEGE